MQHYRNRILGVLLIAPWLVVPRCERPTTSLTSTQSSPTMAATMLEAQIRIPTEDPWRRTDYGWERADRWLGAAPKPFPSPIHKIAPWTLALLQLLISVGALLLEDKKTQEKVRI